ncbi:unnamed protein product [Penicillium salamii]|uniref:Uncharacterized protein n=1 Tax=Penicillium salamii TaxID=1612424 RepID=A0A9W4NNA7_9EURO|nr:unnamed protein product [Penicillium salamii]CAG8333984.1 unnamed protein product [Penicillium salamii]CAG8340780.1 unnamed protein product [Penicillium salamii]CAG8382156.1 unnamed protein product [Penicillium salamii]CAG8388146.1 unnamed protein product [Penicillium salamii]
MLLARSLSIFHSPPKQSNRLFDSNTYLALATEGCGNQTTIMAEASLIFPMSCLALSLLFVVLFYNASIQQYARALNHNAILPTYEWIKRKLSRTDDSALASEPVYEVITPDEYHEDSSEKHEDLNQKHEELPSEPERPWFFPRSQSRYRESSTASHGSPSPDVQSHQTNRYPDTEISHNSNLATHGERESDIDDSRSESPSFSEFTVDSDDDWDDDSEASFESGSMGSDTAEDLYRVPQVWRHELEQPLYLSNGGPTAILDQVVNWTALATYAVVAPPDVVDAINERYNRPRNLVA